MTRVAVAGNGAAVIDRINRAWRVLGTGFSFLVFGLGGLVLGWLLFPMLQVLVSDRIVRRKIARDILRRAFRFFVELMRSVGVLSYQLIDFDRLDRRGLLIVANHPSLIDTVFMLAFVRGSDCVVNTALWHNPFTLGALRVAGYLRSDSGTSVMADSIAVLERGGKVLMFPEGTRTPLSGEIRLRRGAANIAIRGRRDITPVIIRCTPRTLTKGERWWHVPSRRAAYVLQVREDIPVAPFIAGSAEPAIAARQLTAHLEQYFTTESRADAVA
jgi:1-acyl-sn-glycerol-3-phosphate acyltransferase